MKKVQTIEYEIPDGKVRIVHEKGALKLSVIDDDIPEPMEGDRNMVLLGIVSSTIFGFELAAPSMIQMGETYKSMVHTVTVDRIARETIGRIFDEKEEENESG